MRSLSAGIVIVAVLVEKRQLLQVNFDKFYFLLQKQFLRFGLTSTEDSLDDLVADSHYREET